MGVGIIAIYAALTDEIQAPPQVPTLYDAAVTDSPILELNSPQATDEETLIPPERTALDSCIRPDGSRCDLPALHRTDLPNAGRNHGRGSGVEIPLSPQ